FIIILIVLISKNTSFVILLTMEIHIQAGIIAESDISQVFEVGDTLTLIDAITGLKSSARTVS
ncbi:hypothetical protein KA005_58310, partial [bacterium]|nr:hypothetical protein [bacterium]